MFNLNYSAALRMMINDYNQYVKTEDFKEINFKPVAKWEIDFIKHRLWNEEDSAYWLSYRIGMSLLNEYNVKPIEYFNLVKEESGKIEVNKIEGDLIYTVTLINMVKCLKYISQKAHINFTKLNHISKVLIN
jgi:hypothetical protein